MTTSVTGHLLQGSTGGIPAFQGSGMVAIGADVVGSRQPIRIWLRECSQSLDLLDGRATTGQFGATVALDDRRGVWERADLPFPTGIPVTVGPVRRGGFGGPVPTRRIKAGPWCVQDENQHAPTLTPRLERAGTDPAPDRALADAGRLGGVGDRDELRSL
jgi:hypothetical protein